MNEKVRETLDDPIRLQREINEKVAGEIPSRAWDSTFPIVIAHDGAVHQFGTGTLLRIADCFFLVTVFFFQAEDGIRDWSVTGVQTCALPIWPEAVGVPLQRLPE